VAGPTRRRSRCPQYPMGQAGRRRPRSGVARLQGPTRHRQEETFTASTWFSGRDRYSMDSRSTLLVVEFVGRYSQSAVQKRAVLAFRKVGVIYLFIYCSYSLEPAGYGRWREEINNKSSKTDMRKQARKSDKGNSPPGCRLPQSIHAQLYKN